MSVAETSKAAFRSIKPDLKGRRLEVFNALGELGMASNHTIAGHLGWEINRVTGRVNELVGMNKVTLARTDIGKFGHREKLWRVNEEPEQLDLVKLLDQECGI